LTEKPEPQQDKTRVGLGSLLLSLRGKRGAPHRKKGDFLLLAKQLNKHRLQTLWRFVLD
jgi:hypothetical protein